MTRGTVTLPSAEVEVTTRVNGRFMKNTIKSTARYQPRTFFIIDPRVTLSLFISFSFRWGITTR